MRDISSTMFFHTISIKELSAIGVGTIAVVVVLGIVVLWVISIYNRLVGLRNRFKNAFAQIDVQLKRRYDLIPNLVETAKGYLKHERETLENVVKARTAATQAAQTAASNPADATAMRNLSGAEGSLTSALSRLMLVVERYPELKANQNMLNLSEEIASTENKVAFARQSYNDAVMNYNTARENFPAVIFANLFGFQPAELFILANPDEKNVPKVQF
ncbi:MAG: LemA family protein [Puniceicoccales bacterium]|jgi:LemA protein|nr:LemA family protein [Puniceicoccales bacterium]